MKTALNGKTSELAEVSVHQGVRANGNCNCEGVKMKREWNPGTLLTTSGAYWQGCTLQAAVRLKIFTALADGAATAAEIAGVLKSDERATGLMLNALAAMDLIVKEDTYYQNSAAAQELLVLSSPRYMGHIILHHHHILDGWAQLDQAVKTGMPVDRRQYGEEVERESFLMGMFNMAMGNGPKIAAQIDLAGRSRLLDLGGGPGTYAIHFCLANPELKAVIFDRPTTEPFARKTAEKFGVADRVDFIGGDFTMVDTIAGGPYDVAWLSHILHSNSAKQCQEIINKTITAMEPGGMIIIHDFILDNSKDGPEFPALFSLNMLLADTGGRSYSEEELSGMLVNEGIEGITHHPFRAPNDSSIMYGVKA
jgi:predicted O-methyltransferase YrrM